MRRAHTLSWLLLLLAPAVALGQKTDPAAGREIAVHVPQAKPGVTYQRFVVIGDMGTGGAGQRQVAAAMAQRARGLDLILTVGDNFYPWGVVSADDEQWQTKWKDVYAAPSLQVPWYPSLGNHDHLAGPQPQIDYGKREPRWRFPASYHSFTRPLDGDHAEFFVIDTTPLALPMSDKKQLAWLDQALARSKARWKIVYGHHTLYSHGKPGSQGRQIERGQMRKRLEPLFTKHHVDVYFAGHDHTLEMHKPVKGVHYVVTGAGAADDKAYSVRWTDEAFYAATRGGFVLARLGRDELVIEFVRPDGRTQYAHTIYKGRIGPL